MGATMPSIMALPLIPILFARKVNHLSTSFILIAKYYTPFLFKSQSFESLCAKKLQFNQSKCVYSVTAFKYASGSPFKMRSAYSSGAL